MFYFLNICTYVHIGLFPLTTPYMIKAFSFSSVWRDHCFSDGQTIQLVGLI